MSKNRRDKNKQKRKNLFPSLIITLVSWSLMAYLIYSVDPTTPYIIILFFILAFIALLFTFSILLSNTRRGLTASLAITILLFFRYYGIGNILNFLLVFGLAIASDIYFSNNH